MKKTKTAWLLPFRYAAPADLEHYLERMEAEGWHVNKIGQFSSICMRFHRAQPQTIRYVAELHALPRRDYVASYEAFGWKLAGRMASLYIWRMPYEGKRPEAFTDPQSLRARSDTLAGVMRWLVIFLAVVFVALVALFIGLRGWTSPGGMLGLFITLGIYAVLAAVLLLARRQVTRNRER